MYARTYFLSDYALFTQISILNDSLQKAPTMHAAYDILPRLPVSYLRIGRQAVRQTRLRSGAAADFGRPSRLSPRPRGASPSLRECARSEAAESVCEGLRDPPVEEADEGRRRHRLRVAQEDHQQRDEGRRRVHLQALSALFKGCELLGGLGPS